MHHDAIHALTVAHALEASGQRSKDLRKSNLLPIDVILRDG
jgi:hypothetical protein